jgi:hypothetical protein
MVKPVLQVGLRLELTITAKEDTMQSATFSRNAVLAVFGIALIGAGGVPSTGAVAQDKPGAVATAVGSAGQGGGKETTIRAGLQRGQDGAVGEPGASGPDPAMKTFIGVAGKAWDYSPPDGNPAFPQTH